MGISVADVWALATAIAAVLGYLLSELRHRGRSYVRGEIAAAQRMLKDLTVTVNVDETLDRKLDEVLGSVPERIAATIDQHLGLLRREQAKSINELQILVRDSIGRGETDRRLSEKARARMREVAEDFTKRQMELIQIIKRIEKEWTGSK